MARPLTPKLPARSWGFTLIELLVVMAIVSLLVSIAAPKYFRSVTEARETALKTSLRVMRDAIDQYIGDKGVYPRSLNELVQTRYLRDIPEDPFTRRRDTWLQLVPDHLNEQANDPNLALPEALVDVRSGASGADSRGKPFKEL